MNKQNKTETTITKQSQCPQSPPVILLYLLPSSPAIYKNIPAHRILGLSVAASLACVFAWTFFSWGYSPLSLFRRSKGSSLCLLCSHRPPPQERLTHQCGRAPKYPGIRQRESEVPQRQRKRVLFQSRSKGTNFGDFGIDLIGLHG